MILAPSLAGIESSSFSADLFRLLIFHKVMDTISDLWYHPWYETTRKPGPTGETSTASGGAAEKWRDLPRSRSCLRCVVEFSCSVVPSLQAEGT